MLLLDLLPLIEAEQPLRAHHQHDQQHDVGGDVLKALRQVEAGKLSTTPMMTPPTSAPGMLPKPPSTAAAKALMPRKPMLTWMMEIGASSMPASPPPRR